MRVTTAMLTGAALLVLWLQAAGAATLRFAFQADVNTLDPYSLNETFTLGFQGNIYEGLTRRGPDLAIEPALAESWEMIEPTRWRFHLRRGVTFHNGDPFTADDVLFSFERVRAPGSDVRNRVAGVKEIVKVDDYTVDFVTELPNPILHSDWDTWYIMDREWAEASNAVAVTNIANRAGESYANRHANGTGPFMIQIREPDVRTVAVPNPHWWDTPRHNLTEVVFRPIAAPATQVAALLSGEMDVILSLPIQDIERVRTNPGTTALTGPELRTIFLGLDQARDELLYSSVRGANPFKDRRVRLAFYQAIDIEAIRRVVMRGQSTPAASLVAPGINGFPAGLPRWPYDPAAARALLAEAGYPDGFTVRLNCPNDRYVNDEAICQAVVAMLARVGITVELLAETRSIFFGRIFKQGGYDTSFYLLGWTPSSIDSYNALFNLVGTRDDATGRGIVNVGGYSNPEIDGLIGAVLVETDLGRRNAMIRQAWERLHQDVGYLPLHQQALSWGVRDGIRVVQRPDNVFDWRHVVIDR